MRPQPVLLGRDRRLDALRTQTRRAPADTPGVMRPSRRVSALLTLALFVLGGNFCTFSIAPAHAAKGAPGHACCARRAQRTAHEADATRESTAPCCVTEIGRAHV